MPELHHVSVCVSLHIFLVLIFVHITMFVWYLGYPHTQTGKDHYISGRGVALARGSKKTNKDQKKTNKDQKKQKM